MKTTKGPNTSQKKAIQHKQGPLLVVAGAGTGKTTVITERIKHLITTKAIDAEHILALTFTEKAAGEMLKRVESIMPLGYKEPWLYTFHSFADRILRAEALEIGLDPNYKILSSPEQWILLRKNLFKMHLEYFRPLGNPTRFISDILKFISRLQDENISPENLSEYVNKTNFETEDDKKRWTELVLIYTRYQELKLENSKLDFGDLITWVLYLFNKRPNILKKYKEQFQHILVDEFQDTNYAQYQLIKMLYPLNTTERSLLVVGDDSQSIYKFRGAAISNILEFMRDYPNAEMVTLLQNYRSGQNILDAAYKLIQNNNPDTLESKLGISKQLESMVKDVKEPPEIIKTATLEDEVNFVINKIYEILSKEPQYTYKDIAILARANNHLDPFLLGLRHKGIPYQLLGNRGLYDRDEIRDALALLKIIINPLDTINLYRALNINSFEIPSNEIAGILSRNKVSKEDLWVTVQKTQNEFVQEFAKIIKEFQEQITKSTPVELTFNLINAIRYIDQFTEEDTIENQLSIKNLDIFLNIIKKFEVNYHQENKAYPTIVDLVEHLELMIEAGDNPAQSEIEDIDTVNLLTVHASKGLEFPVVFLINLVADRFPTREKGESIEIPNELIKEDLPSGDEHIQEERRLFYVAITRAKKYLYITHAVNYGGKRDKKASGFLSETAIATTEYIPEPDTRKQDGLFGVTSEYRNPKASKITDFTPPFLSYTQIDTYETCPLKYKYSFVLKVPTMPSHALSFGTSIHDTLRDYHTKKMFDPNVNFDEVLKMYDRNWQPLGYMNEEHRQTRYQSGKQILEKYFHNSHQDTTRPVAIEKQFNIKFDGIRFYGRIDRIDPLSDKKVEIIDYKTGNPKTQKEVDKDRQMAIYAIAVKEAMNLEASKLTLHFLEADEKVTTSRTDTQLLDAKQEIKEVVSEIKKGNFEPKPGMHCKWCDYKEICPFAFKG